ncbi:MAG: GNAT family N-acetyltransferase, partial [Desulfobacteraceae bacterium]|nr:GNAT family N-acetyltransferase [Desulfobacteraceae bacterium]
GNIIIKKELRGRGFAAELIKKVIEYLHKNKQILTFRLGSVPLAIDLYKKVGFHAEAFTTAQEAWLPLKTKFEEIHLGKNIKVERINADDLEAISEIDQQYFKSNRLQFLMNVYNDSIKKSCLCLKNQGKVVGFLMLRRRQASKSEGRYAEGPDYVYRLGPSCVLPEYGFVGFKALFQKAIQAVNKQVSQMEGSAKIYVVFPKDADKKEIYKDTHNLAKAMGMDAGINLDRVFDEHDHIFGAQNSIKNEEQWNYMKSMGFNQEYFEQVMSYTPAEALNTEPGQREAEKTRADPKGIFASATPGDKA